VAFLGRNHPEVTSWRQHRGWQPRYALLRYTNTGNLGDEIQSLAARRFLPKVDYTIDRDKLNARPWSATRPVRLIMNGWFTHHPENWPPHPAVEPLLISLHFSDQMTSSGFSAAESLVVGDNAHWLRRHGPVGARDLWTLDLLQTNGIAAWFSGCLSLTLSPPPDLVRQDYVVINDLSDDIARILSHEATAQIVRTTHIETKLGSSRARFAMADELLRIYAQAGCVITSRLHCALPCLAMGTPVLFVPPNNGAKRFGGYFELVHHCTAEELRHRKAGFDLNNPPANPLTFLPLRDRLIEQCTAYVTHEGAHRRAQEGG
jgi:hypothetical protein